MISDVRVLFVGLLKAAMIVVAANIVFFSLIAAVDTSIDHRIIRDRLVEAARQGVINDQDNPPELPMYSDRFTDCLAMSLNLPDSPARNAFEMIRDTEIAKIEVMGACRALVMMLKDRNSVGTQNYVRYWHGYQIISKPFLRFGDVRDLRYIVACMLVGLVFLFSLNVASALVNANHTALFALWFAAGYLLLTDGADMGNVFTHGISLVEIFAAALGAFWAVKARSRVSLLSMAVLIGCVNSFFDLLFNPPLGLSALAVGVVAAKAQEPSTTRDILRTVVVLAIGWGIGFFGTYACRFVIALLLSPSPLATLQEIVEAGLLRVSGGGDKIKQVVGWATVKNYGYPMLRPSFAVFVAITAAFAAALRFGGYRWTWRPVLLILLAPGLISVLWFEALRNHSQHHHWFTYRSASFSLVCLAACLMFGFSDRDPSKTGESAHRQFGDTEANLRS